MDPTISIPFGIVTVDDISNIFSRTGVVLNLLTEIPLSWLKKADS